MRRLGSLLFAVAMAGGSIASDPSDATAQAVVGDGDFSTWTEVFSFSSGVWSRLATGGHPDAHLALTGTNGLSSVVLRQGTAGWDPAAQGPLATIRFAADVQGTSGGLVSGQPAFAFALLQGSETYLAPTSFDVGDWTRIETLALTPTDFVDTLNPGRHPDFSSSGAPMQLGVATASNLSAGFDFRVDNFEATLAAAPPTVPVSAPIARLLLTFGLTFVGLLASRPPRSSPAGPACR
ncbi:MAG: hypothetical protein R3F35_08625 [Myxococcota bacterium]